MTTANPNLRRLASSIPLNAYARNTMMGMWRKYTA
jgi:hypothetical protein